MAFVPLLQLPGGYAVVVHMCGGGYDYGSRCAGGHCGIWQMRQAGIGRLRGGGGHAHGGGGQTQQAGV